MSDYFFYDMNKKMADLAKRQQLTEDAQAAPAKPATSPLRTQLNERDLGKHNNATTGFAALAKKTGGGEKGARIAGAQLAKMRAKGQVEEGSKPDFLDLDKDGDRKEPMKSAARGAKKGVAGGSVTPNITVNKVHDDGHEKEWHIYRGKEMIGYVIKNQPDTAEGLYIAYGHGPGRAFVEEFAGLKPAVNYIASLKEGVAEGVCSSCGCKSCKCDSMDESALQAAFGKKKYGDQGMKALQQAGRNHAGAKTMNNIRNKYDKYDEGMTDEGNAFSGAVAKAKANGIQPGEKINVGGKTYPVREADATPQDVASYEDELKAVNAPQRKASAPRPPVVPPKKPVPPKPKMYPPQAIDDPVKEGGVPMTPKQKKFAALAKPFDKITFADKIVGAKKEVDEMLGDVAANAMKKAVRGRNRDMEEGFLDDEPTNRRSSTGGRIDTTQSGVTRHHAGKSYSGAGHDAGADDEPSGAVGRRKVGAGMGKKIGAKINRGTSKLMTKEGDMPEDMIEPQDQGEYDQEGQMAKDDIKTVVRHAQALEKILGDSDNLPEWVQSKLAKIEGMMTAVDDYMQNQKNGDMETEGKKQHFDKGYYDSMDAAKKDNPKSIVKARKQPFEEESDNTRDSRAEKAGRKVAKDIEYDEKKKDGIHGKRRGSEDDKAEKAGKKVTKDIEYDEKKDKKKKEVDETTSSGSVATSSAAPKSGGGVSYGKGIYDSLNRQLENMISESMNINMSMNNDEHGGPKKSLTVTATDEDAVMLAGILKMAGMGHGDEHIYAMTGDDSDMHAIHDMDSMHGDEPCADCGSSPCGCDDEMMDEAYGDTDATENDPDWPTDEEGTDNAMMYSGGLNGPKSTGQTTIPVIAGQDDRMGYNGLDEELSRMMEMAGVDSKDKYEKLDEFGVNLFQPTAGLLSQAPDEYNDNANLNALDAKYNAYIKKTEQELEQEMANPRSSPAHIKFLQDQIKGLRAEQLHNFTGARSDDAANALRKQAIAKNELTLGQWLQKATQYFKGKITGQPQPGVEYDRYDYSKQAEKGWTTPTPYKPPVKESNDDTEFSESIQRMREIAGLR